MAMDDLLIRGGHNPHRNAVGVSTVVVNGEVVLDAGDHTGALSGRVLQWASGIS